MDRKQKHGKRIFIKYILPSVAVTCFKSSNVKKPCSRIIQGTALLYCCCIRVLMLPLLQGHSWDMRNRDGNNRNPCRKNGLRQTEVSARHHRR